MPDMEFPTLRQALEWLFIDQPRGRRIITVPNSTREKKLPEEWVLPLLGELEHPAAAMELEPSSLVALAMAANGLRGADPLVLKLRSLAQDRWIEVAPVISKESFRTYYPDALLNMFPDILSDAALARALAEHVAFDSNLMLGESIERGMRIPSREEARLVLAALRRRGQNGRDDLPIRLFRMIGNSLGWSPWVQLFAILFSRPDWADPMRSITVDTDRSRRSREAIAADLDAQTALIAAPRIRRVAARLLELEQDGRSGGQFGTRPADNRSMYVRKLIADVGDDDELRQAAIEWLLWVPEHRSADIAQFAAARLLKSGDEASLAALEEHPFSAVGYGAASIGRDGLGLHADAPDLPPVFPGFLAALPGTRAHASDTDAAPRTWIGDRMAEQLIEQTIAGVEARMATEYEDHAGEGEESLLTLAFSRIADQFDHLQQVFASLSGLARGGRRFSLRYRRVDKPEEGKPGIDGARRFATDLCLIVDPILEGRSLGKRASLLQAKRLQVRRTPRALRWDASFALDIAQIDDLMEQTESGFLLFQAPSRAGRGIPVMPARLARDLAAAQGGGGARISRDMAAIASRSLAEWLTYDFLALRVGDPWDALVAKAEGQQDRKCRRLLEAPRLEIAVEVKTVEEE